MTVITVKSFPILVWMLLASLVSNTSALNVAFGVKVARSPFRGRNSNNHGGGGSHVRGKPTPGTKRSTSAGPAFVDHAAVAERDALSRTASGTGNSVDEFNQACQQYIAESRQDYTRYLYACSSGHHRH